MCSPYNGNKLELRTGIRNLTCLFTLGRWADYMLLRREDISFEDDIVVISWNKRNKPKGLKVAKEELRSIGLMVSRLND